MIRQPEFAFEVADALVALKAIYQAPYLWARPVGMVGSGQAFWWSGHEGWKSGPNSNAGDPMLMPHPEWLFGRWQVVSPQSVLNEHRQIRQAGG